MITEPVLAEAVAKGLVTSGQAEALRSLARQTSDPVAVARAAEAEIDPESFRLVSGFADIFVTIGLVLFLGAAAYLVGRDSPGWLPAAVTLVLAWGLAEFFTRRRRMALPSILLLLVFSVAGFAALMGLFGGGGGRMPARLGWISGFVGVGRGDPLATAAASLGTAALIIGHYWRFRVPITIAAGVATLALTALMLLYAAAPAATERWINQLLCLVGVVVFALAMRFDLSDPDRRTRRTDIAFWLHLLAAPLIVHSLFTGIGVGSGRLGLGLALLVLLAFLGLGAVALLVDRRALLVSGLVYAGIAFGSLIASAGLTGRTLPVTMLALGAFVLALSAGWTPLRRLALGVLPPHWAARLPRPLASG